MLYVILALVLALCGLVFFVYRNGKKHGEKELQAEAAKELIDDVHVVKNARDLLARNKSVRDKLRSKYQR